MKRIFAAAAALCPTAVAAPAFAEWPADHPIRVLVGFGAGGCTDIVTRIIQPHLSELLHQTIVVENKPAPAVRSPPTWSPRPIRMATPPR